MSMRDEFTRKTRGLALKRCDMKCEGCGLPLRPGRFQFHHAVEANDGGEATLENCQVLCTGCHAPLTKAYTQALRKAERVRDKNSGAFLKTRNPIPGSRATKWKRCFDGSVVLRSQGIPDGR